MPQVRVPGAVSARRLRLVAEQSSVVLEWAQSYIGARFDRSISRVDTQ